MPTREDYDQLGMLAIGHYVVAALIGLFGSFPMIHVAVGIAALCGYIPPTNPPGGEKLIGVAFVVFGGAFLLMAWSLAICIFLAGRCLATYRWYLFCFVMAGFTCSFFPFGTVLGVFTIVVLVRPGVKALFEMIAEGKTPPALE